ncbi:YdhK family protein [Corynebacterium bovis]|uniref:YdhK family protein n=1 Tax=Corynebacterium bovis TaxID=36808 RepID=UPI00244A8EBD|nr:YdhK family protein [Corynebacterium bovis]MDH2455225.1 YdhK family protein [Corynebacterium bovis]
MAHSRSGQGTATTTDGTTAGAPSGWRRVTAGAVAVGAVVALAACSGNDDATSSAAGTSAAATSAAAEATDGMQTTDGMNGMDGMGEMDHRMDGGPAPAGIRPAASPRYPVGSKVTLTAEHMEGMAESEATVVGAFDTTTYAVNYTPVGGGDPVVDHKWVVQEELENPSANPVPDGGEITILADHMDGMKGAHGTVASSTMQTVYMVDYTVAGMTVRNHKWVVEDEMEPRS